MRIPVLFGWAKPVPYNPYNLKNPKTGAALIGMAGPLSNFSLAVIFAILARILNVLPLSSGALIPLDMFLNTVIFINLLLGVFNLVPIPPLDGSKILFAALPSRYRRAEEFMERNGMWILLLFIFFGIGLLEPIIRVLYAILAG